MNPFRTKRARSGARRLGATAILLVSALVLVLPISGASAFPNPATVPLGDASPFTVLAGSTVTNSGDTVISADEGVGGNLGVSPGDAITGFPPGVVTPPGDIHIADTMAGDAKDAAGAAMVDAAGRTPNVVFNPVHDIGGQSFTAGVYNGPSSLAITGSVTLDAEGNPDAVFIFQAASTLVTAGSSSVVLTNGAQACNVFWQVGSSATLGANSTFSGNILASVSASLGDGVDVEGRILVGSGAVTLLNDQIHTPACAPDTGIPQSPFFGPYGYAVALVGFAGAGLLVVRRRTRPFSTS